MEGILYQRVSPLLKCVVLFLFIFTAKVLTTRPQESQDGKNSIHHLKPTHFVRTFTKYHHRRTIQWNQDYWPSDDQPKVIQKRNAEFPISNDWAEESRKVLKRNVDIPNSNEFIDSGKGKYPLSLSESLRDNFEKTAISNDNGGKSGHNDKNSLSNEIKKYKVKAAFIPTSAPTVPQGSTISCLYKTNRISISSTPSYEADKNAQFVVENESFDIGPVSEQTLPNGQKVQVEQCTDSRAYCYTLWHQDGDGNITVLGQGCWRAAARAGRGGCDRCTRVTRLPATKFCCCTIPLCNHQFLSIEDETVTMKAESTLEPGSVRAGYGGVAALAALALLLALVAAARALRCDRGRRTSVEKSDVMGSGPDAMATGLLCVDNLTLIEHIGRGKFGSVWRGSLGGTPVAVKLYSNPTTWQREAAVYSLPQLAHPNILRYYGSDSRAPLSGGGSREYLVVLELCSETLRSRLTRAPLSWPALAHLAHGLAAALAHLHSHSGSKPCVVHRDVNSNNVLVSASGARLADLGLAQPVPPRAQPAPPHRIAEAGTLRYLAPEALEGALDLSEARAALCAVDVFALGLVLWEMCWRCAGAHPPPAPPPYALPYSHQGLPDRPTLAMMQSLVSRNKARPPLPRGPGGEGRALRLVTDTCDECWDHDAEASAVNLEWSVFYWIKPRIFGQLRASYLLTAVCVEERMRELTQLVRARPPPPTTNNLHHDSAAPESDKNSNVTSSQTLPPPVPPPPPPPAHTGRNACTQRNTHTDTDHTHTPALVHRSLKDMQTSLCDPPPPIENCLSVARLDPSRPQIYDNSNEIRSYRRPIEFVANDVSDQDRRIKQTNLLHDKEKPKWGIRKFFENLGKHKLETEVKLIPEVQNGRTKTSIVDGRDRPSNLVLDRERSYDFEAPCTLSPPNRTLSPTMLMESDLHRENRVFGFKELPSADDNKAQNQIFAVIVPKAKPTEYSNLIELQNARGSSDSMKNSVRTSMSSQSFIKNGNSESEDSTVKKRLSCDNRILNGSGRSSRASINLELQYMENNQENFQADSPFDLNSDCSSSEDEHLMLLSENGGSKITMQTIPKPDEKRKNDVLRESSHKTELGFNFQNKYKNFDNEFSDPNDKENLMNGYSGDNPVYIAALNGEIDTTDLKILTENETKKSSALKRQRSLEHVSEIFTSSGDVNLLNPAGRVKTPGDLPAAVRRARRDRALTRGQAHAGGNRLSLYDDRMMFGNSL